MVYVISQDGKPLMPCSNPIARLLLKQGKAYVEWQGTDEHIKEFLE